MTPPDLSQADIVVQFFDRILGSGWQSLIANLNTTADSVAPSMIYELLSQLNSIAAVAMAFIMGTSLIVGAMGTAHEGVAMGKKSRAKWYPLRVSFSFAAIAPVVKGLSLAQVLILAAVGYSIQFSNTICDVGLSYLAKTGGQVMLAAPLPQEDQARVLAAGILRSMALQRWHMDRMGSEFSSQMFVESWVADQNGGGTGKYVFRFSVPTAWDGLKLGLHDGDFGAVEMTCPANDDAICLAKKSAVYQLAGALQPLAIKLASDEAVTRKEQYQALEAAAHNYTNAVATAVAQASAAANSATVKGLQEFKETAETRGFAMLGSYYWTISRINERALEGISIDTTYDGPNLRVVNQTTTSDFGGIDKGLVDLGKEEIAAAHTAESNSAWATLRRFFNIFPSDALNWSIDQLSQGDIILTLSNIGHAVIGSIEATIAGLIGAYSVGAAATTFLSSGPGSIVGWLSGGAANMAAGALTSILSFASLPIWTLAIGLYVFAFVAAYYIPALPYILWISALIGWILLVIEAIVAAPLWCVAHAFTEGEGIAGERAQQGYMLLLNILMRPVLLTIGMFFAYVLIQSVGYVISTTFKVFAASSNGDHILGIQGMVAYFIILVSLMVIMSHKLFGVITHLPNNIIRWLGQQAHDLGEAQDEQRTRAVFGAMGSRSEKILEGNGGAGGHGPRGGGDPEGDEGDGGLGGNENDHTPGIVTASDRDGKLKL